jgi:hypothetical protein
VLASLRTGIRATMAEFAAALAVEAPSSSNNTDDAAFTGLVRAVAASVADVAERAQLVMDNGTLFMAVSNSHARLSSYSLQLCAHATAASPSHGRARGHARAARGRGAH